MIDRHARDAMSEAVQSFMDQRIGSDKFDDTLNQITSTTQDGSVRAVKDALWSFYSDTEDHKIRLTKQGWDLLNRLRLALASDVEAEWYRTGRRWNIYRTIFALCLAGFGVVALCAGFGMLFVLYWVLAGFVTCTLVWVQLRNERKAWSPSFPTFPFPSISAILSVRRQVPNFARARYPKSMASKAKLHGYLNEIRLLIWLPFWVLMAPLALLLLALPIRRQEMRLKMPGDTA
jgi:hypothetical protein